VVELPASSGFNTIIMVIDLASKRAYFLLIHTIVTIEEIVELFLYYV